MVYQQFTTAILDAYKDRDDVTKHLEQARAYRAWLESIEIKPSLRNVLVEQAQTIESAFERLAARR
jgi:predicted RNA-binding Zn ribbon-like protein